MHEVHLAREADLRTIYWNLVFVFSSIYSTDHETWFGGFLLEPFSGTLLEPGFLVLHIWNQVFELSGTLVELKF